RRADHGLLADSSQTIATRRSVSHARRLQICGRLELARDRRDISRMRFRLEWTDNLEVGEGRDARSGLSNLFLSSSAASILRLCLVHRLRRVCDNLLHADDIAPTDADCAGK